MDKPLAEIWVVAGYLNPRTINPKFRQKRMQTGHPTFRFRTSRPSGSLKALIPALFLAPILFVIVTAPASSEQGWLAKIAEELADPVTGLRSNSGVDIVKHDGGVWVGTTNGVSFTNNLGVIWSTYNDQTGLNANNTSAMFALGNRIWVATAKSEVINEVSTIVGAGIQYSDDAGFNWLSPTDLTGTLDSSTVGPVRVTFDISGSSEYIFATSFVGGLTGSNDGGDTWRHFHATQADFDWFNGSQTTAPPLTSRYFSALVDTAHTDSTLLFAGSAGGISRFEFIDKHIKPSSPRILDLAYSPAGNYIYFAGDRGLSRADAFSYNNWVSAFSSDGLPGDVINQVHYFGGKLFIGIVDSVDGDGIGFVTSDPNLTVFPIVSGPEIDSVRMKAGAAVFDFADYQNRYLYLAGGSAGLFVSADSGSSWAKVPTDTVPAALADPANGRNSVYAVRADSLGNLWCGTDSGLVKIYIDSLNLTGAGVDSVFHLTIVDAPQVAGLGGAAGSSRRIEIQNILNFTDTTQIDSTIIWSASHPTSDSGTYTTYRILPYTNPPSIDTGIFLTSRVDQMAHRSHQVLFAGPDGLRTVLTRSFNIVLPQNIQVITDTSRSPQLSVPTGSARSLLAVGDTTHLGTNSFAALTTAPTVSGINWHLVAANQTAFAPDSIALYTFANSGLPGNFVTAMGSQRRSGLPPIIWAATRSSDPTGLDQTMVAKLDFARGSQPTDSSWVGVPGLPEQVWNFAFDGDSIYAATEEGLYFSVHPDSPFIEINISTSDPDVLIPLGTPINGVAVIDNNLWTVSPEGIALREFGMGDNFQIFRVFDSTGEVFAFPVPFNPNSGVGEVKFHYIVPVNANSVSISIHDFAMNLVSQVNQNASRTPGDIIHGELRSDRWDGKNDLGEDVAPGIYYFKVAFSNGDVQWGKLALIP